MRERPLIFAVFVLGVVLYANTLANDFVHDDVYLISENPRIRSIESIPALFVLDYWEPAAQGGLYRPLVTSSYALSYALTGLHPAGYHAVNILLHAGVSILVLLLVRRVTGRPRVAIASGFLFAALAVHTEAVSGVVGRAELLCAAFVLGSLLTYIRSTGAEGRSTAAYVLSLLLFAAALLSKENGITLLGLIVLYDLSFRTRNSLSQKGAPVGAQLGALWRSRRRTYAGYVGLALVVLAVRVWVLSANESPEPLTRLDNPLIELGAGLRILTALWVLGRYLGLMLLPDRLSHDYSLGALPRIDSLSDPIGWLVIAATVAAVAATALAFRRNRILFFAIGFFAITVSVVSNIAFPIGAMMGERLVYLPSVGFCLALALALDRGAAALGGRREGVAFALAVVLIVVGNGARTMVRNQDWKNGDTLTLHDVVAAPAGAKLHYNAGEVLVRQGKPAAGIEHLVEFQRIAGDVLNPYPLWGHALLALGRNDEAVIHYERAIARGSDNLDVYNNIGFILVESGQNSDRGVELLELAVQGAPNNFDFLDSLGWAYHLVGRSEEGAALLRKSLRLNATSSSSKIRKQHLAEVDRALRTRSATP